MFARGFLGSSVLVISGRATPVDEQALRESATRVQNIDDTAVDAIITINDHCPDVTAERLACA